MPLSNVGQTIHWPDWLLYFRQFDTYFILFAAAAICTAVATPMYIRIAARLGWVDHPFGRKQHARPTATMGGLVIFAVVFCGAFVALRLSNLVGEMLRANVLYIRGLLACTGSMLLLGVIDDRYGVRPRVKLLAQTVVAVAAVLIGFRVEAITLPWLDSVVLPAPVGVVLSLLWIVGITNAINLTDGLDGLAAGICLLASAVNAVVAMYLGNHYMSVMMVLLAGSLLGFLRWNFHPARVFLGDTGSLALGMYLALASLHSAQKAHTVVLILIPLFALGYPIFDTLLAIARRMVRGQPLFASDRDHIHHRLVDRSAKPSWAAVEIYAVSVLLCLLCIAAMTAHYFVLGVGIAGTLVLALFGARVLGYLEWGGWTARWYAREETKVLHAAAQLARLKIEQARDDRALLGALAVFAPEIACRRMVLESRGHHREWTDLLEKIDFDPTEGDTLDVELTPTARIQLTFPGQAALDDERRQLLEDLCRLAGERLEHLAGEAAPDSE